MALTDASFLLFWLLAIGLGQRFLERPGPARAVALGLAVGVAQLFKYNGWIAGVLVALERGRRGRSVRPRRTDRHGSNVATWGWGLLPRWSRPSSTGPGSGSSSRMAGMPRSGPSAQLPGRPLVVARPLRSLQLAQDRVLSGGVGWLAFCGFAAAICDADGDRSRDDRDSRPGEARSWSRWASPRSARIRGGWFGTVFWISSRVHSGRGWRRKRHASSLVGWVVLSILTPFYHPYARLLLPVQAFGWLLLAGHSRSIRSSTRAEDRRVRDAGAGVPNRWSGSLAGCWLVLSCWRSPCRRWPTAERRGACSSPATRSDRRAARSPARSPQT